MYCIHCGKEIKSEYKFCTYCGTSIPEGISLDNKQTYYTKQNSTSIYAVAGFILSILGPFTSGILSILGLIFSIKGRDECIQTEKDGLKLAQAGIIISSIVLIIVLVGLMFVFLF